jgi:hypothetical protein
MATASISEVVLDDSHNLRVLQGDQNYVIDWLRAWSLNDRHEPSTGRRSQRANAELC